MGGGGGRVGKDHVSLKLNRAFRVSLAKNPHFHEQRTNIWLFHGVENSLITEALDLHLIATKQP